MRFNLRAWLEIKWIPRYTRQYSLKYLKFYNYTRIEIVSVFREKWKKLEITNFCSKYTNISRNLNLVSFDLLECRDNECKWEIWKIYFFCFRMDVEIFNRQNKLNNEGEIIIETTASEHALTFNWIFFCHIKKCEKMMKILFHFLFVCTTINPSASSGTNI